MPETLRTALGADTTAPTPASGLVIDMGIRHRLLDFVTDDLTLYAIARDAGISTNTIYKLSADPAASMSWVVLAKLCQVLKCQPGDLLSYDPDGGEG